MSRRNYQVDLNEMNPAAANALLGDIIAALISGFNSFQAVISGSQSGPWNPVGLSMGSTDDQVATLGFNFSIAGLIYNKAAVPAGTAFGAQTVPADKWAVYRASIATNGTITLTPGAANATTGYNSEALALAAIPAVPAGECDLGYLTVKTAAGQPWVAATDALEGGASGNPASVTHYYSKEPVVPQGQITPLDDLP